MGIDLPATEVYNLSHFNSLLDEQYNLYIYTQLSPLSKFLNYIVNIKKILLSRLQKNIILVGSIIYLTIKICYGKGKFI